MTNSTQKQLILVELNEVNLDMVRAYLGSAKLAGFRELLSQDVRRTTSEPKYEELEPWIQWVSAHTGLTYREHGVFRLGDITLSTADQYYEILERNGLSVGAISPMNAANRLKSPAYFVPDPWTLTESDGSFWSRSLYQAVRQAVNDNAQSRVSASSALVLVLALMRFAQAKNYALYLRLLAGAPKQKWKKALILDLLLHDVHMRLWRKSRPSFSSVFLNAGAHIQHHYMLNAKKSGVQASAANPAWYVRPDEDPFADMLEVYDRIIADYLRLPTSVAVATGLTQTAHLEPTFYWRLKDHATFLNELGIRHKLVAPRMTRDFLVEFASDAEAAEAEAELSGIVTCDDGEPVFGEIENRGASLFVTLTYGKDVTAGLPVRTRSGKVFDLQPHVAFVAIKNGEHDGRGFLVCKGEVARHAPETNTHVKAIFEMVLSYFGVESPAAVVDARAGERAA